MTYATGRRPPVRLPPSISIGNTARSGVVRVIMVRIMGLLGRDAAVGLARVADITNLRGLIRETGTALVHNFILTIT